jgi:Cysteine-rich secretory protein family
MATLSSGQCLQPGQSLQSDNQLHTLIMQPDGNVVLYNQQSQPLWSTDTGGLITPGHFAMQADGNLVLYDTDGGAKWASHTYGNPGAFLNIQDDGNLVVYRSGAQAETADNALWAAGSNDNGSGAPSGQGQTGGQSGMAEEILAAHSRYRAEVGMAPLQWSEGLAADAQPWADYLVSLGEGFHLIHSQTPGQGESIWAGGADPSAFTLTQMVDDWASERQFFVPGPFTGVGSDGSATGHYTQIIWRDTTEVGCAIASGNGNTYLVCRYSPPGNVVGQDTP